MSASHPDPSYKDLSRPPRRRSALARLKYRLWSRVEAWLTAQYEAERRFAPVEPVTGRARFIPLALAAVLLFACVAAVVAAVGR